MKIEIKKFLAIAFSLVFLFLTFVPLASATENEITEVNITVPVPKVGEKIPYHDAITVDNEKCRVGLIGWFYEKTVFRLLFNQKFFFLISTIHFFYL